MRYNYEDKITPRELQEEMERYEVEERERLEAVCWQEYEEYEAQKRAKEASELEAMYMLVQYETPVKIEDVEAEIEEYLYQISDKKEEDPFIVASEERNPHKGISYRRKQARRKNKELVRNAIATNKELPERAAEDQKNHKPAVRMAVVKENRHNETRAHMESTKYHRSYKSQAGRARRLWKAAEKLIPGLEEISQKRLKEVWQKMEEARAARLDEKRTKKEACYS